MGALLVEKLDIVAFVYEFKDVVKPLSVIVDAYLLVQTLLSQ